MCKLHLGQPVNVIVCYDYTTKQTINLTVLYQIYTFKKLYSSSPKHDNWSTLERFGQAILHDTVLTELNQIPREFHYSETSKKHSR